MISRLLSRYVSICLLVLANCLTGCGAGIVGALFGIKSLQNDADGNGNVVGAVSDLRLAGTRSSPAVISFLLSDAESDPTTVEVAYDRGGEWKLIARLESLEASPSGVRHEYQWDYQREIGTGYHRGFTLRLQVESGAAVTLSELGVGNDPPLVTGARVPGDDPVVGIAAIEFTVADSSSDLVSIDVEYQRSGIDPEDEWHAAHSPAPPFTAVQAPPEGRKLVFFWDVVRDVGKAEAEVRLRITANDDPKFSESRSAVLTSRFRVSNNNLAIGKLFAEEFIQNPDRRRGIPVPFSVRDADGDGVRAVFQWRLQGQSFPELPRNRTAVEEILGDQALRRQYQIATEKPLNFEGRVTSFDAREDPEGTRARLWELAAKASPLVGRGVTGRELEILRKSWIPEREGHQWRLETPIAAAPLDRTRALVLERPSPGTWRLREVDLGSGEVLRAVREGSEGGPTAMALGPLEADALFAVEAGGDWTLLRVRLADGAVTARARAEGDLDRGAVRGLAVLAGGGGVATVGRSLLALESTPGSLRARRLLGDLKTPWGLAPDPLRPNRVYLAERDGGANGQGQISAIELHSLVRVPLVALGGAPPVRPTAIAVERWGTRLLSLSEPRADGIREIRILDLGSGLGGETFSLAGEFQGDPGSIATGAENLRLAAIPSAGDLAVGGGVIQKRRILEHRPLGETVTVDRPFAPRPRGLLERWRIPALASELVASPEGKRSVFLWDSGDVPQGGAVVLRMTPYDSEAGIADDTAVPRPVDPIIATQPMNLEDPDTLFAPQAVIAEDLDGDGNRDLGATSGLKNGSLVAFFQEAPRKYRPPAVIATGLKSPRAVVAGDLNGDGRTDLATANADGNNLTLFFQKAPGVFGPAPDLSLGDATVTRGPRALAAADLDADGDLDLISVNTLGNNVTVFLQSAPGVYGTGGPIVLRWPGRGGDPEAVVAGDFDQNGLLDLAVALAGESDTNSESGLRIFYQVGAGRFEPVPQSLGGPSGFVGYYSIVAEDLDADGDLDLATIDYLTGEIHLFHQADPRRFGREDGQPDAVLRAGGGTRRLQSADLDGDGRADLAAVSYLEYRIAVFFQKPEGGYSLERDLDLATDPYPGPVLAEDLDGDGHQDLVTGSTYSSTLQAFYGRNGEEFSDEGLVLGDAVQLNATVCFSFGDLDSDGDLDLIKANQGFDDSQDALEIFLQRAPGNFSAAADVALTRHVARPTWIQAVDLDGDGALDLAVANLATVSVMFREGGARPGIPDAFATQTLPGESGALPLYVTTSDVDGNGLLDVVTANGTGIAIFPQLRPRAFASTSLRLRGDGVQWMSVACADLNADGFLDLTLGSTQRSPVQVFFQSLGSTFSRTPDLEFGTPLSAGGWVMVSTEDIDRNGRLDVAVTLTNQGTAALFLQGTDTRFLPGPSPTLQVAGGSPCFIDADDLNGDGAPDLVAADNNSGYLSVFYQRSAGRYPLQPDRVLLLGVPAYVDWIAELDGDGDPEVASTTYGGGLFVYFGNH